MWTPNWPRDAVSRQDDNAFLIVLIDCSATDALAAAGRIWRRVGELPVVTDNATMNVTASLGVARSRPEPAPLVKMLLLSAECALYQTIDDGRDRIELAGADELFT